MTPSNIARAILFAYFAVVAYIIGVVTAALLASLR